MLTVRAIGLFNHGRIPVKAVAGNLPNSCRTICRTLPDLMSLVLFLSANALRVLCLLALSIQVSSASGEAYFKGKQIAAAGILDGLVTAPSNSAPEQQKPA